MCRNNENSASGFCSCQDRECTFNRYRKIFLRNPHEVEFYRLKFKCKGAINRHECRRCKWCHHQFLEFTSCFLSNCHLAETSCGCVLYSSSLVYCSSWYVDVASSRTTAASASIQKKLKFVRQSGFSCVNCCCESIVI